VRGVGHEASRVRHGALGGRGRFLDEEVAARGDQHDGRQCRAAERRDELRIAVGQLHLVSDHHGDERLSGLELESLGVQRQRVLVADVYFVAHRLAQRGALRSGTDERAGGVRRHRCAGAVEQIESAIGNAQLIHSVDDRTMRAGCLHLANAGRAHKLLRRVPQRIVELLRELGVNHAVEPAAQEQENQTQRRRVPEGEAAAKPRQRLMRYYTGHSPSR
jgi:hypothetical protein